MESVHLARRKEDGGQKRNSRIAALNDSGPTEDEIRKRAYEIYQERDGITGNAVDDWLQAEAELKLRSGAFL